MFSREEQNQVAVRAPGGTVDSDFQSQKLRRGDGALGVFPTWALPQCFGLTNQLWTGPVAAADQYRPSFSRVLAEENVSKIGVVLLRAGAAALQGLEAAGGTAESLGTSSSDNKINPLFEPPLEEELQQAHSRTRLLPS